MIFCFLFLSCTRIRKCSQKRNVSKILLLLTLIHRALDGSLAHDDVELAMLLKLGELQGLKRIAIPETDTNWVLMLVNANNLSEIMVYELRYAHIYNIFEEVEDKYAAGIRFKIELVDVTDEDRFPSCYGTPIFEDLLSATETFEAT